MVLPDIRRADIRSKRVFLRCDLDVTLQGSVVADQNDLRLVSSLATIKYLLEKGAIVIIGGHIGRPKGQVVPELSLEPIVRWYAQNFQFPISNFQFPGEMGGWKLSEKLFILENLRFFPGEEANDPEFSKKLSLLADIYVNDAFAVCHRTHASIVGIAKLLPHFAGLHLQEEVKNLSMVLENPQRPLVIIIGGAKIETKMPLALEMKNFADYILVGGLVAQEIDSTTIEKGKAEIIVANSNPEKTDITRESAEKFLEVIAKAKMIVWNGPMGKMANGKWQMANSSEYGTREIADAVIKSQVYKIAGGGDTVEYLSRENLLGKFDFVSTGGGSMLAFLSDEKLPGIEVLIST